MSAVDRRPPRSAFFELSGASTRELVRNKKGPFSILLMVGFVSCARVGQFFASPAQIAQAGRRLSGAHRDTASSKSFPEMLTRREWFLSL